MTRLQRLRQIRCIELDRGLRALAGVESRCGQLAGMQGRLADLAADLPATETTQGRQAAAAGRERLQAAAQQVAVAAAAARSQREAAAQAVARLRVRVDVVETAMRGSR
jgi:hypothetical protein